MAAEIGEKIEVADELRGWAMESYNEPVRRVRVKRDGVEREFGVVAPVADVAVAILKAAGITGREANPSLADIWEAKKRVLVAGTIVDPVTRRPVFTKRDREFVERTIRQGNWLDVLATAALDALKGIDEDERAKCACGAVLEIVWKHCPACGAGVVHDADTAEERAEGN